MPPTRGPQQPFTNPAATCAAAAAREQRKRSRSSLHQVAPSADLTASAPRSRGSSDVTYRSKRTLRTDSRAFRSRGSVRNRTRQGSFKSNSQREEDTNARSSGSAMRARTPAAHSEVGNDYQHPRQQSRHPQLRARYARINTRQERHTPTSLKRRPNHERATVARRFIRHLWTADDRAHRQQRFQVPRQRARRNAMKFSQEQLPTRRGHQCEVQRQRHARAPVRGAFEGRQLLSVHATAFMVPAATCAVHADQPQARVARTKTSSSASLSSDSATCARTCAARL
ncbi:hypothetical protein EDB85DRAFT_1895293 [Lactarius pseudohatsudake]|nr:hypothetical protein EDB85DRAFT_1895293 [Lactarius pseudohatsudake]